MILTPNEGFEGTFADQQEVRDRLAALRSAADLGAEHPGVSFVTLPEAVGKLGGHGVIVRAGLRLIAEKFADYGITDLLSHTRFWVGWKSVVPGDFGGFHRPYQGYRHWQAGAVITMYGDLSGRRPVPAELRALDLIRSYAHDGGGHWSSYRRYVLHPSARVVYRTRYGYNSRDLDGTSYSKADAPTPEESRNTRPARNLGVIMEGGTDLTARQITAQVAEMFGITEAQFSGVDRFAFRDLVGSLDQSDHDAELSALRRRDKAEVLSGTDLYLARMAFYDNLVSAPYAAFLNEVGRDEAMHLHEVLYRAMLTGERGPVSRWLQDHHGRTFAEMFQR
ncbi:hypothetical protein [Actinomadura napierensis]|uniref:Uncharacterized protein n=1 Tax=Actinomadura napierensis TaxID=267854 RepID=A0ABN2ZW08_9ACTN